MLICTFYAQVANSRLTCTLRPVILTAVNSAGNAALQITDAHVEGYRAALDDVRAEIGALAGTGMRAHDEAIADVLELIEKLQFRNRATVVPQRRATTPAAAVPPNDAAGVTGLGSAGRGLAGLGAAWQGAAGRGEARQGEANSAEDKERVRQSHFETIRRYSLGLPTRG
jgi:hypothetical protein